MGETLKENYSNFDGRLGFGERPALVVVDFARAYVDEESPLYAAAHDALASTIRLIEASRLAGIPIVYTRVLYHDGPSEGGVFWRKAGSVLWAFNHDSPFAEWAEGIAPLDHEIVIDKHYASSFFQTELDATLKELNADTVIIAGVSTSGCVRATALDACQYGYVPIVVRDAVGDRRSEPHESNLFDLDAKYADVVGEAEVLEYLAPP
jgi:nicotinamidase-related amidase